MSACGRSEPTASEIAFDSAHSVALDGLIPQGRIVAGPFSLFGIRGEIEAQLRFAVGQLNGLHAAPDLQGLEISLLGSRRRLDGRTEVSYAARFVVSWPRESAFPDRVTLVLPTAGDWTTQLAFLAKYGDESGPANCLAPGAHDVSIRNFWYHYRPESDACPLKEATSAQADLVVRFPLTLARSARNTAGKAPEYDKVWEDGALLVTAVFGKDKAGSTDDWDAGVAAYVELHDSLVARYGPPSATNLAVGEQPSAARDDVRLVFPTAAGPLDVHIYLIESLGRVDAEFRSKYGSRTRRSDLVAYSGHSDLGANMQRLARLGSVVAGQYQVFFVNGCDTFAYIDRALHDARQQANPAAGPDKYLDVISNAMPAYFSENADAILAVVDGLVERKKTYREILEGFPADQRAAVTGEEDNRWPLPFDGP
jgi:hypothetical protein